MKIAFDFDETLTAYPEFFTELSKKFPCYVITTRAEREKEEIVAFLKKHKIKVKKIICASNETQEKIKTLLHNYPLFASNHKTKALKKEKIDVFFEDDFRLILKMKKKLPKVMLCSIL